MDCEYSKQLNQVRIWANSCHEQAYLSDELYQELPLVTDSLQIHKLEGDQQKPLLVAFLGGTGVGKSSLLNRLAGEAIAKSGIERPTSKEVTLYHHTSLVLNDLPASLPFTTIKVIQHHDDNNRHVIWLDMPDFDSVDNHNQHLVLEWLPHIDILIYVVSPERYRDRKAWELLLAEGHKHAWLFVMNQWDRGQSEQFDDLQAQIALAGFINPFMFKTSCLNNKEDDFADLVKHIQGLTVNLQSQILLKFQEQRCYQELSEWLDRVHQNIQQADFTKWHGNVELIWHKTANSLPRGLDWSIRETAQYLAENVGPLKPLEIWDAWSQSCLNDALDDISLSAIEFGFPHKQLRNDLLAIRQHAPNIFHRECEIALRKALSNPGNRLQRFMLLITKLAETLLPLLAMAVVGYQVFVGFYQSSVDERAYLGVEFAIHSILLIGLSWLIPFYLNRQLQPSRKTTAINGLQAGIERAFHAFGHEIKVICQKQSAQQDFHLQQLERFKLDCQRHSAIEIADDNVKRMISQF